MKKRLFCLLLIATLLLAAAVPAGAEQSALEFTDASAIHNYNQVMMLVDLGLISGYGDGSFHPASSITRAEVAKLVALVMDAEPVPGSGPDFTDTAGSWAGSYIRYCAQKGVIGGDGNGLFRPQDDVTAQELAKMLIIAVGRDGSAYVGAGWASAVNRDAEQLGIYLGFASAYDEPVTRDNACLLIYNAMQCSAVAGKNSDGTLLYATDELMNPKTYLEARFGLVRYTAVMTGNECADLTAAGGTLAGGVTKIAGHKAFAVSSDLDLLGRTVDIFTKDGAVVGRPVAASGEAAYTFTDLALLRKVLSTSGYAVTSSTAFYENFDPAAASILDTLPEHAIVTLIDNTSDKKLDTVLVTPCQSAVVLSVNPLTARVGEKTVSVGQYRSSDVFAPGDEVWYAEVRGAGYILAN